MRIGIEYGIRTVRGSSRNCHLNISISHSGFQAVRDERAPVAQWSDDMPNSPMGAGSNLTSAAKKQTKKTVMTPSKKILGVNKISHPRSAVEARRKHRQSSNMTFIKSERLMVIAL